MEKRAFKEMDTGMKVEILISFIDLRIIAHKGARSAVVELIALKGQSTGNPGTTAPHVPGNPI